MACCEWNEERTQSMNLEMNMAEYILYMQDKGQHACIISGKGSQLKPTTAFYQGVIHCWHAYPYTASVNRPQPCSKFSHFSMPGTSRSHTDPLNLFQYFKIRLVHYNT